MNGVPKLSSASRTSLLLAVLITAIGAAYASALAVPFFWDDGYLLEVKRLWNQRLTEAFESVPGITWGAVPEKSRFT